MVMGGLEPIVLVNGCTNTAMSLVAETPGEEISRLPEGRLVISFMTKLVFQKWWFVFFSSYFLFEFDLCFRAFRSFFLVFFSVLIFANKNEFDLCSSESSRRTSFLT